jgi:ketosteroid isomerase-like protein
MVTIRDELSVLNEQFADAFEDRDADRLAELYDDEAVFLSQGTATVVGRDQIREFFRGPRPSSERTVFEVGEVLEDGDVVVDFGTLRRGETRVGRYVVVYRRQPDGSVRLAVDVPLSIH